MDEPVQPVQTGPNHPCQACRAAEALIRCPDGKDRCAACAAAWEAEELPAWRLGRPAGGPPAVKEGVPAQTFWSWLLRGNLPLARDPDSGDLVLTAEALVALTLISAHARTGELRGKKIEQTFGMVLSNFKKADKAGEALWLLIDEPAGYMRPLQVPTGMIPAAPAGTKLTNLSQIRDEFKAGFLRLREQQAIHGRLRDLAMKN
ncbi:MAG: hypothetical protein HY717_23405 [Planctomycetes bacterium]|nr:hypothetical protein [Planctomycetota bacterium]